jgi:RimJ/RimL family protein N-acetyltransferase
MDTDVKILTDAQLSDRVLCEPANHDLFGEERPDGSFKRWPRLDCCTRPGHNFVDRRDGIDPSKRHVVLSLADNKRIVAVAGLQVDPDRKRVLMVTHVSVEEDYWGNGFARKVVRPIYPYALFNRLKVNPSSFSPMGKERLAHIFAELDLEYPQLAY